MNSYVNIRHAQITATLMQTLKFFTTSKIPISIVSFENKPWQRINYFNEHTPLQSSYKLSIR